MLEDVLDLGLEYGAADNEYENCEFCGQERIRYIHVLSHPDHANRIRVGCVCAEHLTQDYVNPRAREAALRNLSARRSKWTARDWRWSSKSNLYLKTRDGHHVIVCPRVAGTTLVIDGVFGRRVYPDIDAAKLAAFDYLYVRSKRMRANQGTP